MNTKTEVSLSDIVILSPREEWRELWREVRQFRSQIETIGCPHGIKQAYALLERRSRTDPLIAAKSARTLLF